MFFDQIKEIDGNLKDLKERLQNIGSAVDAHFDQLDDIAAHIIALEAVMVQVMKTVDVDMDAAKAWIREATAESTGTDEGSTKAQTVLEEFTK